MTILSLPKKIEHVSEVYIAFFFIFLLFLGKADSHVFVCAIYM